MNTPTPTPDPWVADGYYVRQKHGREIAYFGPHHTPADEYPLACRLQDEANAQWVAAARNELAAAKGECERLKFSTEGHLLKTIQQQAELARLRAQNDQFSDNLSAVGKAYNAEKDRAEKAETELARLRAEFAVAENWVDDLIGENVRLRADLERFTGHGLLDCHAICDQRDAAVARAERAEAEVERLKELLRIESASAQHALAAAERAELKLEKMATALADCISTFRSDDKTTIITAERQEAWRAALLSYKPDHTFT